MVNIDTIQKNYPLHWLVWNNNYVELEEELSTKLHDIEKLDNRGRTPLMLAVTLSHMESVGVLLQHEANVNTENTQGWNVVQEAVGTGNPELIQMVLAHRDYQRYCNRVAGIPELLHKLKQAPDFYVEMKWEFTSWVPLASRICPSDTYKVYKQGSNVRIDTTLLGFDHTKWQRGNRSYIFKGQNDGATMMEVDHKTRKVYVEHIKLVDIDDMQLMEPSEEGVLTRLTNPIVTTYIDTDKISFERNKAGLWGWRSDKSEIVNGHECKVFSACNVELITKTRLEHLSDPDKARARAPRTPLQSFLGMAEQQQENSNSATTSEEYNNVGNPSNITAEEYFDPDVDLNGRDIGRPKEVNTKIQKFKATLWLSEQYPLSLQEQIMPIVDLMAISSSHFAKLRDFIQMQLPAGFPVKIEIPLFHILNARITFGNIFGMDQEVPHVGHLEETNRMTCLVDDICFEAPVGYVKLGAEVRTQFMEEEDDLLQFAIQQSLLEVGSERDEVDIWEALRAQKPSRPTTPNMTTEEERQLQRAIQASLALCQDSTAGCASGRNNLDKTSDIENADSLEDTAEQLRLALRLSELQQLEEEQRRLLEEETFRQVLELSLTDK
ncbi:ankyrin repeat domain-containing protein 13D isoform X4 [Bombus vosnesenskii]|uniref:Ankyrin repeat domain-containing protein 13D isoform X4 n=2 Tax=Pyrobombus TaxID=144703 RepID=A0A6J3KMG1_9HYME|nr:ankyrin repeat domain-containing protein 13D isoform X4 [Bombus vancouverensis nearcticus]XP_033302537.1 ankyrin repeat domain-containing protein 13D isoform X4 [Bombus bifarius]XP_033354377.1 ankyrin repeat domain-containing protein 13D isoform X4 [Bombus vosnesenskii]XP_050472718.1 ankyrin repeat domain-containing protein 13D isoform X4 [Bombus huntii]